MNGLITLLSKFRKVLSRKSAERSARTSRLQFSQPSLPGYSLAQNLSGVARGLDSSHPTLPLPAAIISQSSQGQTHPISQ